MLIRPVTPAERPLVCELQIASWRAAYADILPASFLGREVEEHLRQHWSCDFGPNWIVNAAWDQDVMLGFVALDLEHNGGPYIDNLHVAPSGYRRGVGRALLADLAELMMATNRSHFWLTVIESNQQARAFYEAVGGSYGPTAVESLFGHPVTALEMHWHDMGALVALGKIDASKN